MAESSPVWAGNLQAIDRKTGQLLWSHEISDYTGETDDYARATPAIAGNMLFLGGQRGAKFAGARVIRISVPARQLTRSTPSGFHKFELKRMRKTGPDPVLAGTRAGWSTSLIRGLPGHLEYGRGWVFHQRCSGVTLAATAQSRRRITTAVEPRPCRRTIASTRRQTHFRMVGVITWPLPLIRHLNASRPFPFDVRRTTGIRSWGSVTHVERRCE